MVSVHWDLHSFLQPISRGPIYSPSVSCIALFSVVLATCPGPIFNRVCAGRVGGWDARGGASPLCAPCAAADYLVSEQPVPHMLSTI